MIRDKIISEMAELQIYIKESQNTLIKINNLIYSKARLIGDMVDEEIETHDSKEAYQKGLDDMTEVFKKLYLPHSMGGLNTLDVRAVFGLSLTEPYYKILTDFSAQAIIEKIKSYEERKKAEKEEKELCEEAKRKVEALAEDIGLDQMMDILFKLNGGE